jgi:signal peptidase II
MVRLKYLVLISMSGMIVSFDQLTKFLVSASFRLGDTREVVPGFFNLTLAHNRGAAFGLLADIPPAIGEPVFFLVPGLVLALIGVFFVRLRSHQTLSIYALSLIVAGALGNLTDRLHLGHVVDFLDFHWGRYHFPAFNLADAAICLGVALLLLSIFREKDPGAGA